MTAQQRLTPADLEARFADPMGTALVAAIVDALRADPDWSVTEFTVGGQLARVELLYHPTGEGFTLSQPGHDQASGATMERLRAWSTHAVTELVYYACVGGRKGERRMRHRLARLIGVLLPVILAVPGAPAFAATPLSAPVFTYPPPKQTLSYGAALTVAVQPIAHAQGYLWSFVQNDAIVYQDLDATGQLDGPTLTLLPHSAAYAHLNPGPLVVRVRAQVAGGQWTPVGTLSITLTGLGTSNKGTPAKSSPTDVYGSCTVYSTTWAERGGDSVTIRGPIQLAKSRCAALVMDGSYQATNPEGSDANWEFDTEACRLHYAGGAGWELWHGHYVIETVTVHYYSNHSPDMANAVCARFRKHQEAH